MREWSAGDDFDVDFCCWPLAVGDPFGKPSPNPKTQDPKPKTQTPSPRLSGKHEHRIKERQEKEKQLPEFLVLHMTGDLLSVNTLAAQPNSGM